MREEEEEPPQIGGGRKLWVWRAALWLGWQWLMQMPQARCRNDVAPAI